jgi:hypothetical protein
MTTNANFGQHQNPVWRDRSNFIIGARVSHMGPDLREQLWAEQLPDQRYRLCCIPFFADGLNLGDVVELDDEYMVRAVVGTSGRQTQRVWWTDPIDRAVVDQTVAMLESKGALIEWYSKSLMAADAGTEAIHEQVIHVLDGMAQTGRLHYGTSFE